MVQRTGCNTLCDFQVPSFRAVPFRVSLSSMLLNSTDLPCKSWNIPRWLDYVPEFPPNSLLSFLIIPEFCVSVWVYVCVCACTCVCVCVHSLRLLWYLLSLGSLAILSHSMVCNFIQIDDHLWISFKFSEHIHPTKTTSFLHCILFSLVLALPFPLPFWFLFVNWHLCTYSQNGGVSCLYHVHAMAWAQVFKLVVKYPFLLSHIASPQILKSRYLLKYFYSLSLSPLPHIGVDHSQLLIDMCSCQTKQISLFLGILSIHDYEYSLLAILLSGQCGFVFYFCFSYSENKCFIK